MISPQVRHCVPAVLLCALSTVLCPQHAEPGGKKAEPAKTKKSPPKYTNRLAKETSPYLLMHAHNPVDWYPWGPEAFAKAKKEGKLVFLSIGYSSCYWCHVMERESFANEEVAALLNKWFVCIKVDREERPDVDHIYMTALSEVMGRSGGWPLSMFLTADAKPFFGFTYLPREDKVIDGQKLGGFKTLLHELKKIADKEPKKIQTTAENVAAATRRVLEAVPPRVVLVELDRKLVEAAVQGMKDSFDPEYGGFGSPTRGFRGPKFPTVTRLELLLHEGRRSKSKELLDMVRRTLDRMAHGGIYDQVGGGFHRYSTERTWTVPHFEKMLYDNAQLAEIYAKAYRHDKDPVYARILRETLDYVTREMMAPEGRFYSSQDAETEEEEGRFYVWTDAELAEALPEKKDLDLIRKVYGVGKEPNFERKYHILHLPQPLSAAAKDLGTSEKELLARLEPLKKKLYDVRAKRERPFLNTISLTAWSGLMIAGFAEGGQALGEEKYLGVARQAADFILKHQRTKDGRLLRTYGAAPSKKPKADVPAFLEDYAGLVHGLLALHDATGEERWLVEAQKLTAAMIEHHGDRQAGGFYFTAHDQDKLWTRSKDQYDGATPSGNSLAARNLVRLWITTGDERYRKEAERCFRSFLLALQNYPDGLTTMAHALSLYLDHKEKVQKK